MISPPLKKKKQAPRYPFHHPLPWENARMRMKPTAGDESNERCVPVECAARKLLGGFCVSLCEGVWEFGFGFVREGKQMGKATSTVWAALLGRETNKVWLAGSISGGHVAFGFCRLKHALLSDILFGCVFLSSARTEEGGCGGGRGEGGRCGAPNRVPAYLNINSTLKYAWLGFSSTVSAWFYVYVCLCVCVCVCGKNGNRIAFCHFYFRDPLPDGLNPFYQPAWSTSHISCGTYPNGPRIWGFTYPVRREWEREAVGEGEGGAEKPKVQIGKKVAK